MLLIAVLVNKLGRKESISRLTTNPKLLPLSIYYAISIRISLTKPPIAVCIILP